MSRLKMGRLERRLLLAKWMRDYGTANTLDANFVDEYIECTGAAWKPCLIGANRCRKLAEDLREGWMLGYFKRSPAGIGNGLPGQGFPTWVWDYRLTEKGKAWIREQESGT